MAQTPEGKVKDAARKLYAKHGAKYDRAVQNGMGKNGRPDDVVRRAPDGHFIGVEIKKLDVFKVTKLQKIWLEDNAAGGGSSMVLNLTNLGLLEDLLRHPHSRVVAKFEDCKGGALCLGHTIYYNGAETWRPAKEDK